MPLVSPLGFTLTLFAEPNQNQHCPQAASIERRPPNLQVNGEDSSGRDLNHKNRTKSLLGAENYRPTDRSLVYTSETIDRNSTIGMAQKRTSTCVNADPRRAISPARYDGFIGRLLLVVRPNLLFGENERT